MHLNGLRNKFCESDESVIASARACLAPMFDRPGKGYEVMPVFSSGQGAGQAPDTCKALGSIDNPLGFPGYYRLKRLMRNAYSNAISLRAA